MRSMRLFGRFETISRLLVCVVVVLYCGLSPAKVAAEPILALEARDGSTRKLTLQDLDALPQVTIRTSTPWHQGEQVFAGPSLLGLIKHHGIEGKLLLAEAINDYHSLIPIDELTAEHPILATRRNGNTMSVRDKGPIFIIYPYSTIGKIQARILSQSVWQLVRLRAIDGTGE